MEEKDEAYGSVEGKPSPHASESGYDDMSEDDSESFENTLTSEVERHSFVLPVKTHSACTHCKVLHNNIDEFKSIFPSCHSWSWIECPSYICHVMCSGEYMLNATTPHKEIVLGYNYTSKGAIISN